MGPYSHTNIERDPSSRLRDLENGACMCAHASTITPKIEHQPADSSFCWCVNCANVKSNQIQIFWQIIYVNLYSLNYFSGVKQFDAECKK